jgi:hypothetical protein
MSDGVFISDRPQLAIARQTVSFASLGLNDPTLTRIIYEVGNPYLSYIPTDEFNPISGITEGKSYLLYLNAFFDGSPALANAVLTNLIPQTTTNVFADERTVFLCTSSVSFATAGITTGNTRLITLVSEGYFTSYDPNDTINGIDGFVEGELYDIDPITDIDLHLYGVTEIRYSDEVLYLDSLEDVVITNTSPDATLPLAIEETLVRNATTGVWENEAVRVKFVADEASLPTTGIENIVYVARLESTSWYWDGAVYQPIGGGGTSYTDEQAQDAVGTILSSEFTYDDATPQISINSIPYSKITGTPSIPTQYTDEMAQDATAALFAAGTHTGITFTYTDASNKIDAVVTGGTTPGIDDVLAVGQALTAVRTIAAGTNRLDVTGSNSSGVIKATSSSGTGSSAAVVGIGTAAIGVSGTSSTGVGGSFSSISGIAISGTSNSSIAVQGLVNSSTTNTQIDVIDVRRQTTGTAANGIGGRISYTTETNTGSLSVSNYLISKWTDATNATVTSQFEIWGRNNGASAAKIFSVGGQGFMQLEPITATAASAITASAGMIVFVNSTNGTFTSVGFWGFDGTSWSKF